MKISVIIPVYNKIRYIATILQQVKAQSFTDFECLIIDDGSSDGSGAVCDAFAAEDQRFKVFHIPNGGVSHARNVGLDAAQGEYITFIDADDGIKPDYLENLIRCAEESKVDLVISGYRKVDAEGSVLQSVIPETKGILPASQWLHDFASVQVKNGLYGCCVAKIFRRSLVSSIRFDECLKLAEDFDFYLNLYEIVDTIYFDDHTGYLYLQDAENSTGNTDSEKIDYLAQLRINLHYRTVLQKRNAYTGQNREIVEKRLEDYAYFVLFHTPFPYYKERFDKLYEHVKVEKIPLLGDRMLRKWLFFCLKYNLCSVAKGTMGLYCLARQIRNGVK